MEVEITRAMIGSRVDDVYGTRVGSVDAVYVGAATGDALWLIVGLGRFSGSQVPVPVSDAIHAGSHVWVPFERDLMRRAPEMSQGLPPLSREREIAACEHYGFSRRVRAIEGLPEGTLTAVA